MTRRFQIEDLIAQDASGVVFQAHDTESGKTVAVRRFFPFGADGGGLQAEEQTAYDIAVKRLAGISHPALRSVICGGCDPVDGMPYIATEWVAGHSLLPVVEQGPLPAESATELITNALEVSELLSQVLAEEAVWVETDVRSIVIGDESSGRRFTFWISPLKWLGSGDEPRGLQGIADLTEKIMGWQGRVVHDQAARGLGGWLNWLRRAAPATTLREAREKLAASIGAVPPASAKVLVTRAASPSKPAKPRKYKKPKGFLIVNLTLAFALACLGAWLWARQNPQHPLSRYLQRLQNPAQAPASEAAPEAAPAAALPSLPDAPVSDEEKLQRANHFAAVLSGKSPPDAPAQPAATFSPDQTGPVLEAAGSEITLEGVLESLDTSGKNGDGKWLYLVFSKQPLHARGKIIKSEAGAGMDEASLNSLIGRKIRITGKVEARSYDHEKRPLILIRERSAITDAP